MAVVDAHPSNVIDVHLVLQKQLVKVLLQKNPTLQQVVCLHKLP